jgi:hypothetical protein
VTDRAMPPADGPAAGRAQLLSLLPAGPRSASGRVTSGHQAIVRAQLAQAPAECLAATLHDTDDDLAAYAVRVRGGLIAVNEGEYVGDDAEFEVALWKGDPARPGIDVTDDLPKGHYDVLLSEIMAVAAEPDTIEQLGEAPRLLTITGGGSLDDVDVRYVKTSDQADEYDWDDEE